MTNEYLIEIKGRLNNTAYLLEPDYDADERELKAAFLGGRDDIAYLLEEVERLTEKEAYTAKRHRNASMALSETQSECERLQSELSNANSKLYHHELSRTDTGEGDNDY